MNCLTMPYAACIIPEGRKVFYTTALVEDLFTSTHNETEFVNITTRARIKSTTKANVCASTRYEVFDDEKF